MNFKKLGTGIFGGSFILLVTINLFNALNYFFHFVMARLLTAADYGILVALMAIFYIFNVPMESIQTVIARYTSREKDTGKIKNIIKRGLNRSIKIASILFFAYIFISFFIAKFLKIQYPLMLLTGLLIFSVFLMPIGRGALQGKMKFNSLGLNMISESVVKLAMGIFLVFIGWKVYGAILGVFLGTVFAFAIAFFSLKNILKSKEEKADTKEMYGYSLPVFIVLFTIMAFYSLDVILAKAFFSAEIAGQYAIASILSKIILFGTFPISKAMFPISSEVSTEREKTKKIFRKSLYILTFGIAIALAIMYFFPELMVRIFSGQNYPEASNILFFLSVAMALMSFTYLIFLYKLSLGKIKNYSLILIFLILEVILLSIYHATLIQYSITLIFLNLVFLFGSIFMFNDPEKPQEENE